MINSHGLLLPMSLPSQMPGGEVSRSPIVEEPTQLQLSSSKPVAQTFAVTEKILTTTPLPSSEHTNTEIEKTRLQNELANQKKQQTESQQEATEQQIINQLAARDREVRNHERAHASVGGHYASAPKYEYVRGPDGINYAVAGEVSIDASPVSNDLRMTIEKARIIKRAALAPAEPSTQDRIVAAEAAAIEAEARIELAALNSEKQEMKAEEEKANENSRERNTPELNTPEQDKPSDRNANTTSQQEEAASPRSNHLDRLFSTAQSPFVPGHIVSQFV